MNIIDDYLCATRRYQPVNYDAILYNEQFNTVAELLYNIWILCLLLTSNDMYHTYIGMHAAVQMCKREREEREREREREREPVDFTVRSTGR